jgi:hypothetical protein
MIRRVGHLFGKALRETGQAIDRLGLRVVDKELYRDTFSRHRPIMTIYDKVCNAFDCMDLTLFLTLRESESQEFYGCFLSLMT